MARQVGIWGPLTYEQFVCLYLNVYWAEVSDTIAVSEGVRIATDRARVPRSWIDLLTDDPEERERWRLQEFAKDL